MTTPENAKPYIVRLVMKVEAPADQPDTAVTNFVDLLVANGLREWVFRVEDIDTGEVQGYFDGYGDPVEIQPAAPTEAPSESAETAEEQPAGDQAESDESLVALAESLNEQG